MKFHLSDIFAGFDCWPDQSVEDQPSLHELPGSMGLTSPLYRGPSIVKPSLHIMTAHYDSMTCLSLSGGAFLGVWGAGGGGVVACTFLDTDQPVPVSVLSCAVVLVHSGP